MHDFIYKICYIYTINENDGNGRKLRKNEIWKKKEKLWLLSQAPRLNIEADYFPVSERTENKPDLP